MGAPPLHERLAADLRGFGPPGILSILVVLAGNVLLAPLGAVLALVWARLSRTPWSELGYVRLASWPRTLVTAVLFGIALKFVMKAVVMPLLGAHPVNQAYQFVVGNTAALPGIVLAVIFAAGFGEETLFRGFLFERLRLRGPDRAADHGALRHCAPARARLGWRQAGHGRRSGDWIDLRRNAADLVGDDRAHRLRPDRGVDDLLESRVVDRPPGV